MAHHDGIVVLERQGEVEDVANLQAFRLDRRRQRAIQHGAFEIVLATQYCEALALCQQVDRLSRPDDVELVDNERRGLWIPSERQVSHGLEALGRLDLDRGFGVELLSGRI